jgi:hypothetical protein
VGEDPTAHDEQARRLATSPASVVGRFTSASNATLLVALHDESGEVPAVDAEGGLTSIDPASFAVYKPEAGEAPLWDFPDRTLWRRELAAFVVDRAIGLGMVPLTLRRDDLEHGTGVVQAFVPHDPAEHYFALLESGRLLDQLRRMVVFDLLVDNADRKAGHLLVDHRGEQPVLRLIDHGVCFHPEPHLRTVAWDFAGEPMRDAERHLGATLAGALDRDDETVAPLHELLSPVEVQRLAERARMVARLRDFPHPRHERQYPWPLL